MQKEDFYTNKEACELLGISRQRLCQIRNGHKTTAKSKKPYVYDMELIDSIDYLWIKGKCYYIKEKIDAYIERKKRQK